MSLVKPSRTSPTDYLSLSGFVRNADPPMRRNPRMPTLQKLEKRPSNGPISTEMFTYRFPRWLCLAVLLLSALSLVARGERLCLWYRQSDTQWTEALPIGNGRLGAMIFGAAAQERLQLNEDTLYAGGPYGNAHADALAALPEVRRFILAGDYAAAQALAGVLRWTSHGKRAGLPSRQSETSPATARVVVSAMGTRPPNSN